MGSEMCLRASLYDRHEPGLGVARRHAAVVSPSESVVFAMMVPSVAILDFTDGDDACVGSASSFHRYRIPPAASTIRLILFVPISCIVGHVGPLLRSFAHGTTMPGILSKEEPGIVTTLSQLALTGSIE